MKPNWPIISIGITGIMFWTSVYYNGFFLSLIILIIAAAILGLWLRLTGRA